MDSKTISNWLRQIRYRANKRSINSDIQISDVHEVIDDFDGKCAYCDKSKKCWGTKANTLDSPFPLSENTPNIQANILPCCKEIKQLKKNNDIIWLFTSKLITQETYLSILKVILKKRGGNLLKQYIKLVTGINPEEN